MGFNLALKGLNIVINFCSMPAMRLKQWVAKISDTLLCHAAHISDITHANLLLI